MRRDKKERASRVGGQHRPSDEEESERVRVRYCLGPSVSGEKQQT